MYPLFTAAAFFGYDCFAEQLSNRALPVLLASNITSKEECYELAKAGGYQAFGIQNGTECWTGEDAHLVYDKHGKTSGCTRWMGGPMKNDIFLISGDTFGINNVNVMVIVMVIVIVTVTVMYRWQ